MKIVVLAAGSPEEAQGCINSLKETAEGHFFKVELFRERGFRERTLDAALKVMGSDDDLFFVGEDIRFTPGWFPALQGAKESADIIGFSMLYRGIDKVQDRGYDLIDQDGRIVLEPLQRGALLDSIKPFGIRSCDALCGCCFWVRASFLKAVGGFRDEGQNRWGEFIFLCEARKKGASIKVLDHFLRHGGSSTKGHPDKALSSTSYLFEKGLWDQLVSRYVEKAWVKKRWITSFSEDLLNFWFAPGKLLVYGAGTVAEKLLQQTIGEKVELGFISGLPEEEGLEFGSFRVNSAKTVDLHRWSRLLITPLGSGEEIYQQYFSEQMANWGGSAAMVLADVSHEGQHLLLKSLS